MAAEALRAMGERQEELAVESAMQALGTVVWWIAKCSSPQIWPSFCILEPAVVW